LGLPVASQALERSVDTATQTKKGRLERWQNVAQIFALPPAHLALIAGKHVLLADDVLTTGATLQSAADALLLAGAAQVSIAALALAQSS
jgi:predicted amidophosphoribosyltransferase